MRDLDDTDLEILRMLAEDGRRSYSDIGEAVGLTPPAVSDRVSRLKETGVIRRFTIDVDRSTLRAGTPVLLRVTPVTGEQNAIIDALADANAVEYTFLTATGDVIAYARLPNDPAYEWVAQTFDTDRIAGFDVELVADADWTPTVNASEFAFECAECGNSVTSEGSVARVGGSLYHFCCPTCESQFSERYDRIEDGA